MDDSSDRSTVKTSETTLEVIEALQQLQGADIDELAEHLDIAPSTAHRHLTTLRSEGYAIKNGPVYSLSLRFLTIGCQRRWRNPAYQMAREKVDELAEETQERAQFIVEEQGRGVYLYYKASKNAVTTDGIVGKRRPLHCSAAGKAILAALPPERVETIVARRGLPRKAENTITSEDELLDELATIREREVAFNDEESTQGLRAVGTAIQDSNGTILGALSVSGPAHRMKGDWYESELPNLILGLSNEIELNIKYMDR